LDAHAHGLVDTLGGLETAFGMALERSGYAPDAGHVVERYPRVDHPFLERLLEDWLAAGEGDVREALASPVLRAWMAAARFPSGVALALMPYSIEIE
jgi:hypothetical protein